MVKKVKQFPLVSILIPVYNVEGYIEETIKSLLCQSYKDFEVIFVDDFSTDKSLQIMSDVLINTNLVYKILTHKINKGVAEARNTLLKFAKGDYIIFLDSDDFLEKTAVSKYVEKALSSNADIIISNYSTFSSNKYESHEVLKPSSINSYLELAFIRKASFNLAFKLFRRSLFNGLECLPGANMGEDYLLFIKVLARATSINYVDEALYIYRIDNVLSSTSNISIDSLKQLYSAQIELNAYFINIYDNKFKELLDKSNAQLFVHLFKMSIGNLNSVPYLCSIIDSLSSNTISLNKIDLIIFTLLKRKCKISLKLILILGKMLNKN